MADSAPNAGGAAPPAPAPPAGAVPEPDVLIRCESDDCGDKCWEFTRSGWHSVADLNELKKQGKIDVIKAIEAHKEFKGWKDKCYGCCASKENCQGEAIFCVERGGDGALREGWKKEWKEPEKPTFPPSYVGPKNRSSQEFRAWAKANKEEAIKFKAVMDYARKCRSAKWALFSGEKTAVRGDETMDNWVRENYGEDHDWVFLHTPCAIKEEEYDVTERLEDFIVDDGEGNCEVGIAIVEKHPCSFKGCEEMCVLRDASGAWTCDGWGDHKEE